MHKPLPSLDLGGVELAHVSGGRIAMDGGAMFGLVPKPLWSRKIPADADNRIPLDTNCVLVRMPTRRLLIDTGYGTRLAPKVREQSCIPAGNHLEESLHSCGVDATGIDAVILSHLHFDHAGGAVTERGGEVVPTFPHARYWVQRAEWDDALSGDPDLLAAYPPGTVDALGDERVIELVEGDARPWPEIRLQRTGGHTRGHQVVWVEGTRQSAVFVGDLCPTHAHLRIAWTMSYDQNLMETRRAKRAVLVEAAARGSWVLWDHDPWYWGARLRVAGAELEIVESLPKERAD